MYIGIQKSETTAFFFAIILSIIIANVLTYPLDLIEKNKYNRKKETETRKVKQEFKYLERVTPDFCSPLYQLYYARTESFVVLLADVWFANGALLLMLNKDRMWQEPQMTAADGCRKVTVTVTELTWLLCVVKRW